MSSIAHILSDLTSLASDSKRKSSEVKQACDKAISTAKSYSPSTVVHDIDDRNTKSILVEPFILATSSGHAKLVNHSIPILNRLILSTTLPDESVEPLLVAFESPINISVDIQLRTLQCLPTLMQNYKIQGENLSKLLGICTTLVSKNKSPVVSNTASATLQQIFSNLYDKIKDRSSETDSVEEFVVTIDDNQKIKVSRSSYEGYSILNDLCNIISNQPLTFFKESQLQIKPLSVLEIIENIIAGHSDLFHRDQELAYVLRSNLVPSLLGILNSPQQHFPLITRVIRVSHILLSTQLDNLEVESEILLSFLNHLLLSQENNLNPQDVGYQPSWEKLLVLEMFKALFSDFENIKSIYEKYDGNPKKKNVIQELMTILSTYLQYHSYLFNDTVRPPSNAAGTIYLSNNHSSLKVSILDHLDKMDAPTNLPNTYSVFLTLKILISYAEGTSLFVSELSRLPDPKSLEANVEFVTSLIESTYPDVLMLFEHFVYSSMDSETFHTLIRALQKFIHTAGLLGLSSLRDGLLSMLSQAITKNISKSEEKKSNANSLQEQGKQLLAFGESLVESFSSTIQSPTSQSTPQFGSSTPKNENGDSVGTGDHQLSTAINHEVVTIRPRKFNSRQATCLRALINLAVSLGSTLQSAWKIIWITFQWVDYYLHGADEYSGFFNHKSLKNMSDDMLPTLTSQDLANHDTSMAKLYESINEYPVDSFHELLIVLTDLFSTSILNPKSVDQERQDQGRREESTCPLNKSYYLNRLIQVTKVNPNKFLISNNKSWDHLMQFFIDLGMKRHIYYNFRIHMVNVFNGVITNVTNEGFKSTDEQINHATSRKSLDALIKFLDKLFELGTPPEVMLLGCETEMHLSVLDTLHELIDKYDTYYQDSWDVVFKILGTLFRSTDDPNHGKQDKVLRDKVRSLVVSSFDTLKLILDEFLLTLPFNQLKILINTLYNFCAQTYDLNISFSSVSYFWLISDSIKSRIQSSNEEPPTTKKAQDYDAIKTAKQLTEFIDNSDTESTTYYRVLNVYLLCTLAKLSVDSRAQVRDGTIQTFFKIVDVHGSLIPSWNLIYDIILPLLLDLRVCQNTSSSSRNDWIDSLSLVLSGLVSIYTKSIMDFSGKSPGLDAEVVLKLWRKLIDYFNELLKLQWLDLNVKIFKSYNDLILPFQMIPQDQVNSEIRTLLYDFWSDVPIEYDFINIQYQETLAVLIECFRPLFHIVAHNFSLDECNKTLNILNKCARYPILPSNIKDDVRPTNLQKSVIDNLRMMSQTDLIHSEAITSVILQQLTTMLIYPLSTRSRIKSKLKSKLNGKNIKIPTFVAISHLSLDIIQQQLEQLPQLRFLARDRVVHRLLASLIEIIESKAGGIRTRDTVLWIQANELFAQISNRLIDEGIKEDINSQTELCELLLRGVTICFNNDAKSAETGEESPDADKVELEVEQQSQERINLKQYRRLSGKLIPALLTLVEEEKNAGSGSGRKALLQEFVVDIYNKSFLYELDDIEVSLTEETQSAAPQGEQGDEKPTKLPKVIDSITQQLANYQFEESFGTTTQLVPFQDRNTRIMCLSELVNFAAHSDYDTLNHLSLKFFVARVAYTLRRFIADAKLLYKAPLPRIQEEEVVVVLEGLISVGAQINTSSAEDKKRYQTLKPLLIRSIDYTSKIPGIDKLIQRALTLQ